MGRAALFCLVLLGVIVAGSVEAPERAGARPLVTGVTVPDTGEVQDPLAYERIKATGASMTRIIVYWSWVAPAKKPDDWNPTDPSDPNYRWDLFDQQIQMAVDAGLDPLVMVYSAPKWAERCQDPAAGICDPDPQAFAQFSEAVAKRYNGDFEGLPRVRYWEPWNEANLFLFFKPQFEKGRKVSPLLYRDLLNGFSDTVKGVNPDNQIVAGGLAPIERPGGLGPLDFARRLLCMKGRNKPAPKPGCDATARFDIWANNPYTTGGPTHQSNGEDDVSLGDLREMGALLKAAKRAGKIETDLNRVPFWITEFSWDSKPPDPGGLPMGLLSRWTSEAMFRAWQAGVSKFFWLTLRDWPRPAGLPYSETIESGLYFRGATLEQDKPKRVLKAFRFPFVAFRKANGIAVWGRTPESTPGRVFLSYRLGSRRRDLGLVKASSSGVFRTMVKTNLGRNYRGKIRAEFGADRSIPFSLRQVKDRWHPPFGRKTP